MRGIEVRKERHSEAKAVPLFTRLNIHRRTSATEKCTYFRDRNISILSAKSNFKPKQDDENENI